MKLILPLALFFVPIVLFFVISVDGNLRGDHGNDDDDMSRTLKACIKKGTFVKIGSLPHVAVAAAAVFFCVVKSKDLLSPTRNIRCSSPSLQATAMDSLRRQNLPHRRLPHRRLPHRRLPRQRRLKGKPNHQQRLHALTHAGRRHIRPQRTLSPALAVLIAQTTNPAKPAWVHHAALLQDAFAVPPRMLAAVQSLVRLPVPL
jgi:hypothetical protein